ncbi:MAG: Asp23/Gls24 family envelope stress response protein [Firmicutes bacterium]|nr:Asp23/Gls24 family envelope stress response protein [Bacillota bacterium]
MADNKYIIHEQENGSIRILEEVVAAIAAQAVREVEGVADSTAKSGADFVMLGKKGSSKGVKVEIADGNEVRISCSILVEYGQSVPGVACAVQESVRSHVESMTGITLAAVNVNVSGIVRA